MSYERDDYMRRQEADHELLRMRNYGPRHHTTPASQQGCICPAGAEKSCRGPLCPRQPFVQVS